ncbi:MAG: TlpA family protein disulfide reductase [bacterium]|nr:TlpA family protein disulfide reductase [bacterium]
MKRVVQLFILVMVVLSASFGFAQDKAPSVTLKGFDGNAVELSQYWENGPVLIDFWATWCTPCKESLPHFDEIYAKYKDKGLQVLAISVDAPKSMSKVQPFIVGEGFTFTTLLDPNSEGLKAFGAKNIPHTVLVGKGGKILHTKFGYLPGDEEKLEEEVKKALAEIAVPESKSEAVKEGTPNAK